MTATGVGPRAQTAGGTGPLNLGQNFGSRYHIIRLLGIGGMGAVYQAWDQVLEVALAIKVIRPEPTHDAETAQAIEKRFKRELLLARKVTHRNVVRIHDLGEVDGITYITMPYVQGSDLATIIKREGRLPIDRALAIARQVASGLAAAHEAGVIHRDLKPANIMVDSEGDALIMDFGIARSTSRASGLTMTAGGAVIGTIEYMAPEQARGETADQRADVYSFGLILNDVLLGRRQTGGATGMSELMARMQQAPAPVRSIDPAIPVAVDALVTRCLQPDPAARYQSMAELIADLDGLDRDGHPVLGSPSAVTRPLPPLPVDVRTGMPGRMRTRWWILGACVVIALAAMGWAFAGRLFSPGSPEAVGPPMSLVILPFRNASGDPTLDSLGPNVSEVLTNEFGQSARVRTVTQPRLHQVLQDLKIAPNATLLPTDLTRVADLTNARRVLSGSYSRFGNAIRMDAILQNLDSGEVVPLNALAPNEAALFTAIADLAEKVRTGLAHGSPNILSELKATSWKPSTTSFEALRLYNEGVRLTEQGTHQEALKSFKAATTQDGNFALGFSALARSYKTLGYDNEALAFSRQAMNLSDALPPQEKYLISANHYTIVNDTPKAIEAYENLVKASPTSAMVKFDLGSLYEQSGALEQAQQQFAKVVELDPKFVEGLLALGRVEIKRGNPQGALDHLNGALELAVQLNHDEARGNILQAIGVAYKRLNRLDDALKRYQESLDIKRRLGNKKGMAGSFGEIAQIQERLGQLHDAELSYKEALTLQREIGDKLGISTSLVNLAALLSENLSRPAESLALLREALQIRRDGGNESAQAVVLNNIGNVYLSKGEFSEAQTYFERTLELREKAKVPGDIADALHNLAETLSKLGKYDESLARYLRALELRRDAGDKRGAAIESYSMGTVFDYQGRYGAAVKSKEDALKTFRDLKLHELWLGEILSGYGNSLSLDGRMDDATKNLDDAMTLATELKNPSLIAQTLRFQADRHYYKGDLKGANGLAEQATQAASNASDRSLALLAQADVAMTAAALQPSKTLAAKLGTLAQEADILGLRALSVDCSLHRAETLLKLNDYPNARQEAERTLFKAEPLGFRVLLAKAHYLRAEALRLGGGAGALADARKEYALGLRALDEIKGEDGSQNVLKRADLGAMHEACLLGSKDASDTVDH